MAGDPLADTVHVFPPALAPVLRERYGSRCRCLEDVPDAVLVHLLTTVFFAGLETYEGERNPVGVVFLGRCAVDVVLPEAAESNAAPLYQWKLHRFEAPRPFALSELVKLAVAGTERGIYTAVQLLEDGRMAITGLAREGFNLDADPFLKVVAARSGRLSIRSGRDLLLGYERGAILTGGEDIVFSAGPVRRALEASARAAGLEDGIGDYLDAVRSLVREMAAHGRGGILIVAPEERPAGSESATYRMARDSSLVALLRLARRIERRTQRERPSYAPGARRPAASGASGSETPAFSHLLRNAFLTEAERVIEELGALTGIDGATLLNRDLGLVAFGSILPVIHTAGIHEVIDIEGRHVRPIDLGSFGTRHRAGAAYAAEHPGCVVFVAAEDGQVTCMFRDPAAADVSIWRLGPSDGRLAV